MDQTRFVFSDAVWEKVVSLLPDKAVIPCDQAMCRWRHLIENLFAKLKEFRAVATRYDKTDDSFRATIHLAAAVVASR